MRKIEFLTFIIFRFLAKVEFGNSKFKQRSSVEIKTKTKTTFKIKI